MIAVLITTVLLVGRTEISFSPFYIRMDGWMNVVGYLLIGIGLGFLGFDSYERGRQRGQEDAIECVEEYVKKNKEEQ